MPLFVNVPHKSVSAVRYPLGSSQGLCLVELALKLAVRIVELARMAAVTSALITKSEARIAESSAQRRARTAHQR